MVDTEPKIVGRKIEVVQGDFNDVVDRILFSGRITQKTATFCLLDQRTFECCWETVRKLAAYKKENKIELFYFLGTGWLPRALAAVRGGSEQVAAWWGRDDWKNLQGMKPLQRADAFCRRFKEELGYTYAYAWPIYSKSGREGRVMYHMIHCTDHDEAPKLMSRAYRYATTPIEPAEQLELAFMKLHV